MNATIYRLLLFAYPPQFRRKFGAAMVADFDEAHRALTRGGYLPGQFRAWRLALTDLFMTAPRERASAWRKGRATGDEQHRAPNGGSPQRGPLTTQAEPGAGRFDELTSDIKFGARTLRRQPGFTLVAILTLGLGIGATTAIFSVIDAVILEPLPYPEPDRLVRWFETTPSGGDFSTSQPNFLDYRAMNATFDDMAAGTYMSLSLVGDGEPLQLDAGVVTPSMFELLGAKPIVGRSFAEAEGVFGADTRIVILSESLWRERFSADPGVAGTKVALDGNPYLIVGVMPESYESMMDPDVWVPLAPDPNEMRGDHRLFAIGRLKDGVTLDKARTDLEALATKLSDEYPPSNAGWGIRLASFDEWLVPPELSRGMVVLLAAVGLLLLIACANVSNLLIARATSRQREIALRASLGAGRARIIRQLMTESVILGIGGAVLGLLIAYWTVPAVRALTPADSIPRLDEASINGIALLFTLVLAGLTGMVFGLAPAYQASGTNLLDALKADRVANSGGRRLRNAMVVSELALAVMLLIGAGLLISSFARLMDTETGFDLDNVLTAPLSLSSERYTETGEERMQFFVDVFERVSALPGVVAVGTTNIPPLSGGGTTTEFTVEGGAGGAGGTAANEVPMFDWRAVSPGFFKSLGVPLLKGRDFSMKEDWNQQATVVIVSETLARQTWPGEDPIGKRVAFGLDPDEDSWLTVVGVAADVRDLSIDIDPHPVLYFNFALASREWVFMNLTVRTSTDAAALAGAIRREIWEVDPTLPVPDVMLLEQNLSNSVAQPRFNMTLMGLFAGAALLLAAVGVYGIMAFSVSQRTHEIGIRMALGAGTPRVMSMVLGSALKLAILGIVVGVALALAASRFLDSMLYRTEAADPLIYAGVVAVLGVVAVASALIPALRATRVDPTRALCAD